MTTDNDSSPPDDTSTTTPPDVAAPPDASEVYGWAQGVRVFDGTTRQSGGVTIAIAGVQRDTGACERWARITPGPLLDDTVFAPEALRQLAAVLVAAAAEIEARA